MNVDAELLFSLLEDRDHDFRAVVDRENDICDSCLIY